MTRRSFLASIAALLLLGCSPKIRTDRIFTGTGSDLVITNDSRTMTQLQWDLLGAAKSIETELKDGRNAGEILSDFGQLANQLASRMKFECKLDEDFWLAFNQDRNPGENLSTWTNLVAVFRKYAEPK